MELLITGTHMDISPEVRKYVERKLGKLQHYLPNIMRVEVEISLEKTRSPEQRYIAQVTMHTTTNLLRGEERAENPHAAIDKVANVMERQMERYKGKLYRKGKGNLSIRNEGTLQAEVEPPAEELPRKVVRVKQFVVKPMSVDEAVDQIELLGHDFFLFFDSETEKLKLLYRRRDGHYGLIEPEMG